MMFFPSVDLQLIYNNFFSSVSLITESPIIQKMMPFHTVDLFKIGFDLLLKYKKRPQQKIIWQIWKDSDCVEPHKPNQNNIPDRFRLCGATQTKSKDSRQIHILWGYTNQIKRLKTDSDFLGLHKPNQKIPDRFILCGATQTKSKDSRQIHIVWGYTNQIKRFKTDSHFMGLYKPNQKI